jgi:hypothetical protein
MSDSVRSFRILNFLVLGFGLDCWGAWDLEVGFWGFLGIENLNC